VNAPVRIRRPDELFAFRWGVPVDGFYWVHPASADVAGLDTPNDSAPSHAAGSPSSGQPSSYWLVESVGPETNWYEPLKYEPLKEEALFAKFADLYPTTEPVVLKFAEHYGALGLTEDVPEAVVRADWERTSVVDPQLDCWMRDQEYDPATWKPPPPPDPPAALPWLRGEQLELWRREVRVARLVLRLWKHLGDGTIGRLHGHFRFANDRLLEPLVFTEEEGELEVASLYFSFAGPLERAWDLDGPGKETQAALYMIEQTVNAYLKKHASPQVHRPVGEAFQFFTMPQNLLGALWLQFARSLSGNRTYKQCQQCNGWFEHSPQKHRRERFVCSGACRQKKYRERHRLLLEREASAPSSDIAKTTRRVGSAAPRSKPTAKKTHGPSPKCKTQRRGKSRRGSGRSR
jgi:hypothetical protein